MGKSNHQKIFPSLCLVFKGWKIDVKYSSGVQSYHLGLNLDLKILERIKNNSVETITFSRSDFTSASLLCDLDWNGFASRESKFGSPAPGTNRLVKPTAVPTPRTSSYGQKFRLATLVVKRCLR